MCRYCIVVWTAMLLASTVPAEVPHVINYQGRLTEMDKTPVNGSVIMTIRIYDDQEGVLWSETNTVAVDNGLFAVMLGTQNPIPDTAFNGPLRYLGIQPDGQPEIVPRTQLVSVPYAYHSLRADTAGFALSGSGTGGSHWFVTDSVLYTDSYWGIARGGAGNVLHGDSAYTMVNLGVASTTGSSVYLGRNFPYCAIGGGYDNVAEREYSTVSGGQSNDATGDWAFIGGGWGNISSGSRATVSGGNHNTASASETTVGGGYYNTAGNEAATVSGGHNNAASEVWATIGGGGDNVASGAEATIGGGAGHIASGNSSTIAGGKFGRASGNYSTIGGGHFDTASGEYSTVSGGYNNVATGYCSSVSGGSQNSAAGSHSHIVGGNGITLNSTASMSFAFGDQVTVNSPYRVVFFHGSHPAEDGRLGIEP